MNANKEIVITLHGAFKQTWLPRPPIFLFFVSVCDDVMSHEIIKTHVWHIFISCRKYSPRTKIKLACHVRTQCTLTKAIVWVNLHCDTWKVPRSSSPEPPPAPPSPPSFRCSRFFPLNADWFAAWWHVLCCLLITCFRKLGSWQDVDERRVLCLPSLAVWAVCWDAHTTYERIRRGRPTLNFIERSFWLGSLRSGQRSQFYSVWSEPSKTFARALKKLSRVFKQSRKLRRLTRVHISKNIPVFQNSWFSTRRAHVLRDVL